MLTKKQNFLETIRGGKPDRFVNQYEALQCDMDSPVFNMIIDDPIREHNPLCPPGQMLKDGWGVTHEWPSHVPGPMPVHREGYIVLEDVTKWRDVVKAPRLDFPESDWKKYMHLSEKVNRDELFVTYAVVPGVFEQTHNLMGIDNSLMNLYAEPEAMKELIEYITEWEIGLAKVVCEHYKPDCLFHHDDWGSSLSSLMSPDMFAEFFLDPYKRIYKTWKENGVEVIVHHNDSYSANLVPYMIEMGIDVWQGCTTSNNVPELVKKYGGQISFMGDIDNTTVDIKDWTPELIASEVKRACTTNGKLYYIPCCVRGGPGSLFPGAYEAVSEEIDKMSEEMF